MCLISTDHGETIEGDMRLKAAFDSCERLKDNSKPVLPSSGLRSVSDKPGVPEEWSTRDSPSVDFREEAYAIDDSRLLLGASAALFEL